MCKKLSLKQKDILLNGRIYVPHTILLTLCHKMQQSQNPTIATIKNIKTVKKS